MNAEKPAVNDEDKAILDNCQTTRMLVDSLFVEEEREKIKKYLNLKI